MKLPSGMIEGRLIKRYKRFMADIILEDDSIVTAHTPNTGRLTQCAIPGSRALISPAGNPARKLKFTLELLQVNGAWVDINTHRANRVVEESLRNGTVSELAGYRVRPEFKHGNSRFDFLLEGERIQDSILVEVKNVTMMCGKGACFPDAPTERGKKHLEGLEAALDEGYGSVIFFLVQRPEAEFFIPADHVDPEYGKLLRTVSAAGVKPLAYLTETTTAAVTMSRRIPVELL